MARLVDQLTEAKIRSLNKPGFYSDGGGLYLQIRASGARSWIFRFSLAGRTRDKGLGSLASTNLVTARAASAECRVLLAKGIDPIESARAEQTAKIDKASRERTFEQAAEEYMAERLPLLRSEVHRHQWRYSLETFAYPIIGRTPIADVDTTNILAVLRPIWSTRCETASRLRGRIERILAREAVEGRRSGGNPAAWKGHLQEALPARSTVQPPAHHRAMDYADVPVFMTSLHKRKEVSAAALQFLILTAARTGEVIGAKWDEIDWDEQTWTVPAERAKAGRTHVVPLSTGALSILRTVEPLRDISDGQIFPGRGGKALSQMTMLALLQQRMACDCTVHGFRSAFRDWCGDEAGVDRDLAEAALAHVVRDQTERAYRRKTAVERRRGVMQAWCDFCTAADIVDGQRIEGPSRVDARSQA